MTDQVVDTDELAQWLRCSSRTIRQYVSSGVISDDSIAGRGQFLLREAIGDVVEHLRTQASGHKVEAKDGTLLSLTEESALLKRSQRQKTDLDAQIKKIELARASGQIIIMEHALLAVGRVIAGAKSKFMGLPATLQTQIHGLDAKELNVIDSAVRQVLEELAHDAEGLQQQISAEALEDSK